MSTAAVSKPLIGVESVLHCIKNHSRGYCNFRAGTDYKVSKVVHKSGLDLQYYIDFGGRIGEVPVNYESRRNYFL